MDKLDMAKEKWRALKHSMRESFLNNNIEVEILMTEKKWESALRLMQLIDLSSEHHIGQMKELYYNWAIDTQEEYKRKEIANKGLYLKMDPLLENNVPLLIINAKLALSAEEKERFYKIISKIEANNMRLREIDRLKDEAKLLWGLPDNQ